MEIKTAQAGEQIARRAILIAAPTAKIWAALTEPTLMRQWMANPADGIDIDIFTDWSVGSPILFRGQLHGIPFENRGTVLQFEPARALRYTHLSSISRLPNVPESYSLIAFRLEPAGEQTELTLILSNFPTEAIYKHLVFYWPVALERLRTLLHRAVQESSRQLP